MAPIVRDVDSGQYDPPIPSYSEAVSAGNLRPSHGRAGSLASPSVMDPLSPMGEAYYAPENESRSLLRRPHRRTGSSATNADDTAPGARSGGGSGRRPRPPRGYRPPTVETDDEDSTWSSSDSEGDSGGHLPHGETEADYVRREMEQLEVEDPLNGDGRERHHGRSSIFGKSIGFSLSLPKWKWNWRISLPRLRMRLPDGQPGDTRSSTRFRLLPGFLSSAGSGAGADTAPEADTATTRRRRCVPLWPKLPNVVAFAVFGRVMALAVVMGLVYLIFMSDLFANLSRRLGSQAFDPESVRMHVQANVNAQNMRDLSKHFSSYAHMAGTEGDYALAVDVKNILEKYGLENVLVDEYNVYLNYPTEGGRAVEVLGDDGTTARWTAKLEEEDVGAETAGHQTFVFHGLSKSGQVQGRLVYANYGTREDFQFLQDSGIHTDGAIALVRNEAGPYPDQATKVHAAELAGFAGCLIYTDPQDGGFVQGEEAPKGRFLPSDAVRRGSVALTSLVLGDVLTPGWESKKEPRLKADQAAGLVKIPSLPLAWRDAQFLLQQLRGAGQRVPKGWQGSVPHVDEWWTGNGAAAAGATASPLVRLRNEQDEASLQPIWNVHGRIVGLEQAAKKVIIGNHRDAWTLGAAHPHSGTAVMLELARIFGDLLGRGWRPLRTIEFVSWDAAEYNLVGSTEYVENNLEELRADALAYLNLDAAVVGGELHAAGSPLFSKLFAQIMKRVGDPHTNATLYDEWATRGSFMELLGAGSDYAAFQGLAGTSSLDLRFDSANGAAPLHTSYDNFDWMDRVGDPGFLYHGMLGQLVGLLATELADRPILPFDMAAYAFALSTWVQDLAAWVLGEAEAAARAGQGAVARIDLQPLQFAADVVTAAVRDFETWQRTWENEVLSSGGWEPSGLGRQRAEYNSRMGLFESNLLDLELGGGIPNRTQYKHVVFGPKLWASHECELFPAVRDAVVAGDWVLANQTVFKIAGLFQKAAAALIQ